MELELLAARRQGEHRVVQLRERRARRGTARAACRRARRACRPARRASRSRTAARMRPSCGRRPAARRARRARLRRSRPPGGPASAGPAARAGSAWIRSDLTLEMPPGRIAASTSVERRVAHRRPSSGSASRSRRKATSRLRSFVDCERTVRISSSSAVAVRRRDGPAVDERAAGRAARARAPAGRRRPVAARDRRARRDDSGRDARSGRAKRRRARRSSAVRPCDDAPRVLSGYRF